MKALRATATLLAGAVLSLAVPAAAQLSAGSSGGGRGLTAVSGGTLAPSSRSGPGFVPGDPRPRPGRPGRNRWHFSGGLAGEGAAYARNRGYFEQGAEGFAMSGAQPRFDYDRGYPYDHYRGPRNEPPIYGAERGERSCAIEATRDRSTGRLVEVRVCRN